MYDSKYRFPLRVDGNVGTLPVVMCVCGNRFVRVEFDFLSSDGGFRDVVYFWAMFNYVGGVWQDYEFVRDITYWLSIRGRTEEFI